MDFQFGARFYIWVHERTSVDAEERTALDRDLIVAIKLYRTTEMGIETDVNHTQIESRSCVSFYAAKGLGRYL
jgi:hypothetical protein